AAADDGRTLAQSVQGHHVIVFAHSHPDGAVDDIGGCPTMCPIPETDTVLLVELWQETNGCPGLQRTESDCGESIAPPDTLVEQVHISTP
ncbi:MAG: hypothetical protein KY455_05990, partial [Euryarchaeota archaeon]|nr:hypothetical protein [Euryarchaeota archaeon]